MDLSLQESVLNDLWGRALTRPWRDLSARPRKEIRSQLVNIGFLLVGGNLQTNEFPAKASLQKLQEAIETLYLGSLIIDDIESKTPVLHQQYGLSVTLNLGNYLYFEALEKIRETSLPAMVKLQLYEAYHHTLLEGHRGQAIDLSTHMEDVDPTIADEICMKSLSLKSGSLAALALKMGALAFDEHAPLEVLEEIGSRFGIAVQMHDDVRHLANLKYSSLVTRPNWVWAALARHFTVEDFILFKMAISEFPEVSSLTDFLERTDFKNVALKSARSYHQKTMEILRARFDFIEESEVFRRIQSLNEKFALLPLL